MFAVEREVSPDGRTATYRVTGQIFFASVDRFTRAFQTEGQTDNVLIDVSAAHFWDISGVGALDKIVAKLRREGDRKRVVSGKSVSVRVELGGRRHIQNKSIISRTDSTKPTTTISDPRPYK